MTYEEAKHLCEVLPQSAYTEMYNGFYLIPSLAFLRAMREAFPPHNWRGIFGYERLSHPRWRLTVDDNDPREYQPLKGIPVDVSSDTPRG